MIDLAHIQQAQAILCAGGERIAGIGVVAASLRPSLSLIGVEPGTAVGAWPPCWRRP